MSSESEVTGCLRPAGSLWTETCGQVLTPQLCRAQAGLYEQRAVKQSQMMVWSQWGGCRRKDRERYEVSSNISGRQIARRMSGTAEFGRSSQQAHEGWIASQQPNASTMSIAEDEHLVQCSPCTQDGAPSSGQTPRAWQTAQKARVDSWTRLRKVHFAAWDWSDASPKMEGAAEGWHGWQ